MTATTLSTTRSISSRAAIGVALGAFLLGGAIAAGAVVGLTDDTASPEPVSAVEQGTAARSGSAVFDPDRGSITAIDQRARSGSAVFDPDRGSITAIDQRTTAESSGAQYTAGAAQNLWEATAPAGTAAGAKYSAGAAENLWDAAEDSDDR